MKRYYIECVPIRRGLTGREYLSQHIDEFFSPVKFYSLFNHGLIQFGYVEGNNETLCNVLSSCEKIYGMQRLFVDEFRGAAKLYWTGTAEELAALFAKHSIQSPSNGLKDAKSYKIKLLKEKIKREFTDYNDLISNVIKSILLLEEYRSSLDAGQTARLENALTTMKSIYDVETCLTALEGDVSKLSSFMPDYYSIKNKIKKSNSLKKLNDVDLIDS